MPKVITEYKNSDSLSDTDFILESIDVTSTKDLVSALEQTQKELNAKLTLLLEAERESKSQSTNDNGKLSNSATPTDDSDQNKRQRSN
ncbi:hypothetical protein GGI25_003894 [Coemansia spiralis]|uniref:Uncharacterized protein n=2 Tax=Coemansia TaxID=4863 RepID=A0A9W8G7P5_9FUNG|nr:hypothetical protein BX070DRAFT_83169 [Coemansia spiralis]KAJ1991059.1 hypothetical protein EDC05_003660 [Coemansia umbellata]KAJ2675696.1 hypothetical protein GGI25_003894 [Coemansia spiralis]